MATKEEVQKLATLARVSVEDAELEQFTHEFDAILEYIGQLEGMSISNEKEEKPFLRNVMRVDDKPHTTGAYTEKIVEQFPASENTALAVKQIISHE